MGELQVLLFLLFLMLFTSLFNQVFRRGAARAPAPLEKGHRAPSAAGPASTALGPRGRASAPPGPPAERIELPTPRPATASPLPRAPRRLLGGREELRRAVLLAELLWRCRGLKHLRDAGRSSSRPEALPARPPASRRATRSS